MWRCRYRVPLACSPDLLDRLRLRGSARCLRKRAYDASARKVDLEGVVLETLGVAQQEVRRLRETRLTDRLSAKSYLRLCVAPRPVRDASECEARLRDR